MGFSIIDPPAIGYPHLWKRDSRVLNEVGADKDKASAVGATALHLAALNGHMEVLGFDIGKD